MADKEETERRIYVLPKELLDRLRAYQSAEGIGSEVEATRRLLNTALQLQDSLDSILKQLRQGFKTERNLRLLANRVLSHHVLVKGLQYGEGEVTFETTQGERGRILRNGSTWEGGQNYDDWTPVPRPSQSTSRGGPSWDTSKGDDLNDEIPF